jgi:Tol biopolymer transport system component
MSEAPLTKNKKKRKEKKNLPLDLDDQQFCQDTQLYLFVSHPAESTDIYMHDEAKNVQL